MIYTVNINDIEKALLDLGGETQVKEIQDYILRTHCNGVIPNNYSHERSFRQTIQRKIEDYCPQAVGFDESRKEGKFLRVDRGKYRIAIGYKIKEFPAIEEVLDAELYDEGATKKITVNYYERDPEARKKCILYYGTNCIICGFNFENIYGEIGKSFIHVHHIVPLSEIKTSYRVNPINDLRPVCANCHAVIHRTTPALSIEELKKALINQSSRFTKQHF